MNIFRWRKGSISVLSAVVIMCTFFFAGSSMGEEIVLKLASFSTPGHFLTVSHEGWIEEVNAACKGRLRIVDYPGGQLYGTKDIHKAVAKGLVDVGQAMAAVTQVMVPMLQGTYLPFFFEDIDHVASAYEGESIEIVDKYLNKKKIKFLFVELIDPTELLSNKEPLTKLEDFKGLRVMASGKVSSQITQLLGGIPDASVAYTDYYMALKRGLGDACYAPLTSSYFRKNFEVAPYFTTNFSMGFPATIVVMNLDKWNSLPKDLQKILLDKGNVAQRQGVEGTKLWKAKLIQKAVAEGATGTALPSSDRKRLKELTRPMWDEWAKANGPDARRFIEINKR